MQKEAESPYIFWGGTDVDARLYGKKSLPQAALPDVQRDVFESKMYHRYVKEGQPVLGICRGAQLMCVLNGGTLWQHTGDHGCYHAIETVDGTFQNVPAGHHQIMNPEGTDHVLLGWSPFTSRVLDHDGKPFDLEKSAEVIYFPKTRTLACQPHPEYRPHHKEFNAWLNAKCEELLGCSLDNF
jgi:carbamoylphosphate synthase small subunit